MSKNLSKLPPNKKALMNENSIFYNAESLVKKYQLRYSFLHHIEHYLFYSKIDAPKSNFDVSIGPDPNGLRSSKWVSIKAYAPLTKDEMRQATKRLLKLQKEFLPPRVVLDLRPKIDIDLAIKIEQEMQKRKREYTENPGEYLSIVKKQLGEKEYERIKKQYGYKVEKTLKQYTSREIAEMIDPVKANKWDTFYDVAYAVGNKIARETGIKDFFITTTQSIKVDKKYLKS